MNRKPTIVVLVAVIMILASAVLAQITPGGTVELNNLGLERQPMLGSLEAPVTLLIFDDFNCPVCREFELDALPRLQREFIEQGQLRFHTINISFFGDDSTTAALAAECVYHQNEAAFWNYRHAIYQAQGSQGEGQRWATPAHLIALAEEHVPDLDVAELEACVTDARYAAEVQRNHDLAVSLGIEVTPVLVLNGTVLASSSYETVSAAVEQALP